MTLHLFRVFFAATIVCLLASEGFAQRDPGVRGGLQNTGGGLQAQGKKIPPPPIISPNPTTEAGITDNEKQSFVEGILRAGQLESTCDQCAMVTDGSPAVKNPLNGLKELDPIFPQFTTNSNGLGARHNADQCFACHGQPTLGGSGGFLVPNPVELARFGSGAARPPENPQFDLIPHRFGKQNMYRASSSSTGPSARFGSSTRSTPMATSSATAVEIRFLTAACISCGPCGASGTTRPFRTARSASLILKSSSSKTMLRSGFHSRCWALA